MTGYWQSYIGQTIPPYLHNACKWVKVYKTPCPGDKKSLQWTVRREWRSEFPSHHAQSLPMGPEDIAMTEYWQTYVGMGP